MKYVLIVYLFGFVKINIFFYKLDQSRRCLTQDKAKVTNNLELREYILYNFTLIYDFEVSYAMLTTITAKIVSQKNKLQKLFICYSYWLNVLVAPHIHCCFYQFCTYYSAYLPFSLIFSFLQILTCLILNKSMPSLLSILLPDQQLCGLNFARFI